ncbi:N-acetyltransferase [Rhodovarius crocodyli]|uniref:N-acetyltransferase n=1 Tax=Rhodovarius crocodyli TaxID=1979269 RepID=A0A437MPF5_9PROT|nr:GNAT family N-acetyltransferase [Rhodovarius crocodyli]RVT99521.1 N-acetyltransferase [Rhodovarius crocodyli]
MAAPEFTLSLHQHIGDIPAEEWNGLAGGNPFVRHEFLAALEDSGSVGRRTGWLPQHAALRDEAGRLVAAAPVYAKGHSYGEYVFDHGWAQAFERAGGDYYPKLQVASPFSPVPGPRLLTAPDVPHALPALAQGLTDAMEKIGCSSVHVTFCTEAEQEALAAQGWLPRLGTQFHWANPGYASFEDALAPMASRKRKQIKRERRDAQSAGLEFRALRGPEITPALWKAFHGFYRATVDKRWGTAYLQSGFWPLLGERLGDAVVLMVAFRGTEPVAAALNLLGPDALHGRNWGASEEVPFLHFELCYYQAMDFAIAQNVPRVEAGAQGEHKIQRGYMPVPTYSAHAIAHTGLRRAVAQFLDQERPAILLHMRELAELSPFKAE